MKDIYYIPIPISDVTGHRKFCKCDICWNEWDKSRELYLKRYSSEEDNAKYISAHIGHEEMWSPEMLVCSTLNIQYET